MGAGNWKKIDSLSKKILEGPNEEAEREASALLEVRRTRRNLVDLPALAAFICGFPRLYRL